MNIEKCEVQCVHESEREREKHQHVRMRIRKNFQAHVHQTKNAVVWPVEKLTNQNA